MFSDGTFRLPASLTARPGTAPHDPTFRLPPAPRAGWMTQYRDHTGQWQNYQWEATRAAAERSARALQRQGNRTRVIIATEPQE